MTLYHDTRWREPARASVLALALTVAAPPSVADPGAGSESVSSMRDLANRLVIDVSGRWEAIFAARGWAWEAPGYRVIDETEDAGCIEADPAAPPFYCEESQTLWLGIPFFEAITGRIGDPLIAEIVAGTVVAHEVGHHVQELDGTSDWEEAAVAGATSEDERDGWSRLLELQADCLSGIWAHFAVPEPSRAGIENELRGLAHSFDSDAEHTATHGNGDDRMMWFRKGLANGDPADCNTFADAPR